MEGEQWEERAGVGEGRVSFPTVLPISSEPRSPCPLSSSPTPPPLHLSSSRAVAGVKEDGADIGAAHHSLSQLGELGSPPSR